MRILVTGGLGFVGINLVRALAAGGGAILCADLAGPDPAARRYLAPVAAHVAFVQADLATRGALAGAVAASGFGPLDAIAHAAALTATTLDVERDAAERLIATNIGGTMEVLELAVARGVRRVLYVSSSAAIGPVADVRAPLDESVTAAPVALYGLTKLTGERICARYAALTGLSTVVARIAQPYGPMERRTTTRARTSPIHEWAAAARAGEVVLVGDPGVARDWTHVADTAAGLRLLLHAPAPRHGLYHVGVGRAFGIGDIIAALRGAFPDLRVREGVPDEDERLNPNIAAGAVRGPLAIDRLQGEIGFIPRFDIATGIADYLGWLGSSEGEAAQTG